MEETILEEEGVDGSLTLKWMLKKVCVEVKNGFIWLRIGLSGRLL
jgi:hypothetical protein